MALAYLNKEERDPEAAYQYILIAGQYVENTQQYGSQLHYATDKAYILLELKHYDEALESIDAANKLASSQAGHLVINYTLSALNLKAEVYLAMGKTELAFQYQSQYLDYGLDIQDRHNTEAIEELRLKYESEQSDLQRKILIEKQNVQSLQLNEANKQAYNRHVFIICCGLIALALAWLLVRTLKEEKKLLHAKQIDVATGLINRSNIIVIGEKAVTYALQKNKVLSLLIFEIDNIKELSQQDGFQATEVLFKVTASLLKSCISKNEKLARLSENEFIILNEDDNTQNWHDEVSEKLSQSMNNYLWEKSNTQEFTLNIGAAKLENKQNFSSLLNVAKLSLKQQRQLKKEIIVNGAIS